MAFHGEGTLAIGFGSTRRRALADHWHLLARTLTAQNVEPYGAATKLCVASRFKFERLARASPFFARNKTAFAAMMLNEALLLTAAALALHSSPLESFVTKLLTGYLFHALEGKQGHH